MNLSQLNEQVRQALNNRDHKQAEKTLKLINELLNGGKGE
ncbi:hypothetical protein GCM10011409_45880 [Lentibacillus populi]|uniref:Uncharacterized protein n=1 Tax=Lentibacillus populi TaxID=1827502 RepID=A0A9W5X7V3_9BACI|nr:hypothetical protein GCM10011409_45880 [Lentibacillus populi]